jgi:hypothetical protein
MRKAALAKSSPILFIAILRIVEAMSGIKMFSADNCYLLIHVAI